MPDPELGLVLTRPLTLLPVLRQRPDALDVRPEEREILVELAQAEASNAFVACGDYRLWRLKNAQACSAKSTSWLVFPNVAQSPLKH
jgi:hypothetical protein